MICLWHSRSLVVAQSYLNIEINNLCPPSLRYDSRATGRPSGNSSPLMNAVSKGHGYNLEVTLSAMRVQANGGHFTN